MPFNGAGIFNRIYNWVNDAANGINILSTRMDAETQGIADGLSNCITRDGQSPPTADIPMGGRKITGLANATNPTDAVNLSQVTGPSGSITVQQPLANSVVRPLNDKTSEIISPADFISISDAIAGIGQSPRIIEMAGASVTPGSIPSNPYGVRFKSGKVLVPSLIGGYNTQLNTYADDVNGLMIGRENLAAWWKSVTAGTFQTIYLYGDSTVANDAGYPLKSHELFKLALYSAGVNNCLTVNRGVSGTSWSDLAATGDLGASTKLIVIKYGINDAVKASPLTTFMADARTKLTAIRAATNGDFANLSILLMGPNSTYRPSTGQDAKWYEDLRNGYLQLCKEFDCAYFDTYAYLQQTKHAPGLWMDNIAASGEGLHPDSVAVYWIWLEGIRKHVLGDGQWNTQKTNQNWNVGHATLARYPTDQPQTFPYGLSKWGVLPADGWPESGWTGSMEVARQSDGVTYQAIRTLDVVPRRFSRTGSGLVWTQWTGVSNLLSAIGYTNSWVDAVGGYQPAGYVIGEDGFVELYGAIKNGTLGSSAVTLPTAARPGYAHAYASTGGVTVTVFANGTIIPSGGVNTLVCLDGMRFKVL